LAAITLSAVVAVMLVAILCVWIAHTSPALPEATTFTPDPPEVSAPIPVPPETAA
ncbi:hypothetical protein M9458_039615, partial [Cirrhinus mrigala]